MWSFQTGRVYFSLTQYQSRLFSFKLINGLDIKHGIRQPIPVVYGMYTDAMAPDHLLGMGLEYLISMTSSGVGGGSFEELLLVKALNSGRDLDHLYHIISSSVVVE